MTTPRSFLLGLLAFFAVATARAQDLRLTEFLATNVNDITDVDGTHQPWIEIWNPNPTVRTSLNNWQLSNGTTSWIFPFVEIAPGERLIVWASGKDRRVVTAPLHTNFTIPAEGGTLTLFRPNQATIASQLANYPAQSPDVSWGRDEFDLAVVPTQVGSYSNPSPGERNNYAGAGVARKVAFDKTSQAYTGTLTVTLSQVSPDPAAEIRYTINGTAPTPTSTLYSAPLSITTTQLIRARVFQPGKLPGETESHAFLLLNAGSSAFSSAIPIVVITNFTGGVPPETGDQPAFLWEWRPGGPDNRARLTDAPTIATRIVIDRRGSSTIGNPKYNLNVEFRNPRDDDDRALPLLGMPADADWVFHAPYDFDKSLIHNPLAFAMSNAIGRYATRNKMAEVFIDTNGSSLNFAGTATGDYFGAYNVHEKIRRGGQRVDITRLDEYDNDAVGRTGGYIVKVDRRDAGDGGFVTPRQGSFAFYYPKEVELLTPQRDPQEQFIRSWMTTFDNSFYNFPLTDILNGYRRYLDVPAAIDHHLVNVWTFNVDALRLSGYMYRDRGLNAKLVYGPVWDFDRALSSTDGRDSNPAVWRSQTGDLGTDFFNYTWWNRLFNDIEFYQQYIDRWQDLRRSAFSPAAIDAIIDALNNEIGSEAVARDLQRWNRTKRAWTRPFPPGGTIAASQDAEMQRLKDYLQQRANFMATQWVQPVEVSVPEGNVAPGTQVTLTGPANATIHYTLDGTDPRPVGGGAPGAGVLTYSGPITIDATTRVRARAYRATHTALTGPNNPPLASRWSGLTDPRYSTDAPAVAGSLLVTEVNYHATDPTAGELAMNPVFEDNSFEFLELKNVGSVPLDLGGVKFTAGVEFTFSGDQAITLAPGAFVIVASNPEGFAARYGSGFTVAGPWTGDLDNGGERITLRAAGGATILDFTYDDAWYPASDGGGRTLALYDPQANGSASSTAANWRESVALGGSPGADEPNRPPAPNAGSDVSGNFGDTFTLAGTGSDDRLPNPPNGLSFAWTQQSGPGTATIAAPSSLSTTATFSLPGAYVLRLTSNDTVLSGFDDVSVFVKDTPSAWLARHPGIGSLDDDFDGDGDSNFSEFARGTDPSVPGANEPVLQIEAGHLTLTYTRIKPPSAVVYSIEVADSADAFRAPNAGEITEQILMDDGLTQTVKVIDSVSTTAQPIRFLRLRISAAP